jgi:hypothetical protein
MKNKFLLMVLFILLSLYVTTENKSFAVLSYDASNKIFSYILNGTLTTPDKKTIILQIKYLKGDFLVQIGDNIFQAYDINIKSVNKKEKDIEFSINPTEQRSTKLSFKGKIVEEWIMGGTVTSANGEKGSWYVKIPDKFMVSN